MNSQKVKYFFVLSLFSVAVIGSIVNSAINYENISMVFTKLGYPVYLIQILGLAQIIGLTLIIFNKAHFLLEWAYAGFFLNYTLGAIAHLSVKDGNGASAVICLVLLFTTYVLSRRVRELEAHKTLSSNPELV